MNADPKEMSALDYSWHGRLARVFVLENSMGETPMPLFQNAQYCGADEVSNNHGDFNS